MGFFKKIFKGIKKVFKKVGKAIKSAFKSVGKFMDKIGIIGQIGLALVLPGIGEMLSIGLKGVGGALASYGGIGSSVVNAAGQFITKAVEIGGRVGNFFSSITEGVTKVVGQTVGAAANSIPGLGDALFKITGGKLDITNMNFFGKNGVWETAQKSMQGVVDAGKNIFSPTVDSSTAAQLTSQTAEVQANLQGKVEAGMGTPDIPAPTMEQPSLLSPRDMAPPTGGVTSAPPTVLESVQAGSYTTDASGAIVRKTQDPFGFVGTKDGITYMSGPPPEAVASGRVTAPITTGTPDYVAPETFGEKLKATGKELYERGIAEAKEEIAGLPKRAVSAAGTQLLTKAGLIDAPEYVTNYTAVNVPTIDMGSTTGIGYEFLTPDVAFADYGQQFIDERPFGAFAGMFDYYREEMAKRGYA